MGRRTREANHAYGLGLGLSLTGGGGGAWTPARDDTSYMFLDAARVSDGSVSSWGSLLGATTTFSQATAADQPSASGGVVTFDGSTEKMAATYAPSRVLSSHDMPLYSGVVGPAFGAPTGLCKVPDGTFWMTTDGRDQGGSTHTPYLIHLSADRRSIIGTPLALAPLYPGSTSFQGAAWDTTDETIWLAAYGINKIVHVNPATGAAITGDEITLAFEPNGLAYHPASDALWIGESTTGVVKLLSCVDGSELASKTYTLGNRDHFCFDGSRLWITSGANNTPGILTVYDVASDVILASYSFAAVNAIEGVVIETMANGSYRAIFVNDGWYHDVTDPVNRFFECEVKPPDAAILDLWYVGRLVSYVGFDWALTAGMSPAAGAGWGIGFNGANVLYLIANTSLSGSTESVTYQPNVNTIAGLNLSDNHLIYVRFDTVADLVSLWIDGELIGTAAMSAVGSRIPTAATILTLAGRGGASGNVANIAFKAVGMQVGAGDVTRANIEDWAVREKDIALSA